MLAGMFACSGSSPAVPASRPMKQTSLDSFSRPSMRLTRREAQAGQNEGQAGHAMEGVSCNPPKMKTKTRASKEEQIQAENSPSPSPTPPRTVESSGLSADAAAKSEAEEDVNMPRGRAGNAPHMSTRIHTAEEGRTYLEEAQSIEPEDVLDSEVLAGTLVQISLFPGMLRATRDTMCAVAFLLMQAKLVDLGDTAVEGIVDQVVDKLADVVKAAMQAAVVEIKSASTALAESSMQFTATVTSCRDTLTSKGSPLNSPAGANTVDMRVRVKEGIKSRQILLDSQSCGQGKGILCGVSTEQHGLG